MITAGRPGHSMGSQTIPQWKPHAIAAGFFILDALVIGVAPGGPWDDSSFSRGVIGLVGICLAYVAWYRRTFKRNGLIPWIDLWESPEESARLVLFASVVFVLLAWVAGNPLQPHLPEPTGLVLALVGLLLGLQAMYVYLVTGPLKEE